MPRKKKEEALTAGQDGDMVKPEAIKPVVGFAEQIKAQLAEKEAKQLLTPLQASINESRKALEQPVAPGQAFYEAPDGFIIVAEADKPQVWYRQGNNGKGMWINPRRV
jgi:hypothetical protein